MARSEALKAAQRRYYQRNKESIVKQQLAYQQDNWELIQAYRKAYYRKRRQKKKQYQN